MKKISAIGVSQTAIFKGHNHPVYSLCTAGSNSAFHSSGADKMIILNDLEEGRAVAPIVKSSSSVYSIQYISENNCLALGQSLGGLHVIDLESKKEIKNFIVHRNAIFRLHYDSHSHRLFSISAEGLLTVWDVRDWSMLFKIETEHEKLRDISVSHQRGLIALACADTTIIILDYASLKIVSQFKAHEWSTNAVCWHPLKNILISGSKDAHLSVWDENFKPVENIPAHNYAIYSIVFNSDGSLMATCSRDKTIKIWDANDIEFLLRIDKAQYNGHSHSVNCLLWHPYHDTLISGGDDGKVIGWKMEK